MKNTEIWPRPKLNPLPERTGKLDCTRICLNGDDWKLNLVPEEKFYDSANDFSAWQDITVPLQITAGETEYSYTRLLNIPEEWSGNRVLLRFDGANCYARVFVDGVYICDHYGGFVSWDCDITDYVTPGCEHRLVIGITNKPKEVSPFHQGGLIRDIILYTLPEIYLARLHVETVFNPDYTDAVLTVFTRIEGGNGVAELVLTSPEGEIQHLSPLSGEAGCDLEGCYTIASPKKWDSEHPYLYTLTAFLKAGDTCLEVVVKKFGFRQLERRGSEVFVNGELLKLRGINRHDIHPITGRSLTEELVEEDVRLLKEANINFIRTSHYPPRPDFLDLCDRYGIYVEDEVSVAFLGFGTWYTQDDPEYTHCYMGPFSEMIERDRSHPSVIIWSLANESYWGKSHGIMNAYAHREDPSRLTIFSYPITQTEEDEPADIWSAHYASWDSKLDDLTECFRRSFHEAVPWPVLHDEATHIPCYDRREQQRDPGVREFWGETIGRFWDRLWDTKGALGCAVWAGIDEVTVKDGYPSGLTWGILDGWRRKKPEYWHIRKGYSPIRVSGAPYAGSNQLVLPVQNRFNHTNLAEISICWRLGEKSGCIKGPDIPPRGEGLLLLPVPYIYRETLEITFTDPFGFCVDEEYFLLGEEKARLPELRGEPVLEWEEELVKIKGRDFLLAFSRETGLITEGYYKDTLILTGGPELHLTGLSLAPWKLESMEACTVSGCAQVNLDGNYGKVGVHFTICVDREGFMETIYTITDMPYSSPRSVATSSSITSHAGGYDEVGIAFTVPAGLDTLSWKRKGQWNVYPDWHIARLEGRTPKYNPGGVNPPNCDPGWDWRMDEMDWIIFGKYDIGRRGTRDFTSMKSNILCASMEKEEAAFTVLSDGSDSVRMEITPNHQNRISDRNPAICYHGNWIRQDTGYGSLEGTETWSKTAGDYLEFIFNGTGIAWYSSLDKICGVARVYIDGEQKEGRIDLGTSRAGKSPRGYQKIYRWLAFSIQNLPAGEHTIRIEVTGEMAEGATAGYVMIDHFLVLDGKETGDTRFIIDNEFNYPEISWANYCKPPISVSSGYTRRVFSKFGR